jgi:ribosomal protein S27AE
VPLSYEQAHKLQEWIPRGRPNCPMCGSGEWQTGEIVSGMSMDDLGNILPVTQLVCGNCGYVMMFAAMPTGPV